MRMLEYTLDEKNDKGLPVRVWVNVANIVQVRPRSTNTAELWLADGSVIRVVQALEDVLRELQED